MPDSNRTVVIQALDKATGILRDPAHAGPLMRGKDVAFDQIEIDSLSVFEMLMFIEEALEIEIEVEDIEDIETVDQLAAYLDGRMTPA